MFTIYKNLSLSKWMVNIESICPQFSLSHSEAEQMTAAVLTLDKSDVVVLNLPVIMEQTK